LKTFPDRRVCRTDHDIIITAIGRFNSLLPISITFDAGYYAGIFIMFPS
jgi:hypothetical protein